MSAVSASDPPMRGNRLRIAELLEAGLDDDALVAETGLSMSRVRALRREVGVVYYGGPRRPTAEDEARILELLEDGWPWPEIQAETGWNVTVIRRVSGNTGMLSRNGNAYAAVLRWAHKRHAALSDSIERLPLPPG